MTLAMVLPRKKPFARLAKTVSEALNHLHLFIPRLLQCTSGDSLYIRLLE